MHAVDSLCYYGFGRDHFLASEWRVVVWIHLTAVCCLAAQDEWVLCRVFKKSIEPPVVAAGKKSSGSGACMEAADVVGPSVSMADDLAACALPPLMDVSGGSGAAMSLSAAAAAAAGIELPPPSQHVTCFSNALEGQFLNPPFGLLPAAGPAAADHLAMAAASASPFLASMMQAQYDGAAGGGGMVHELLQEGGGWYSKLGERERLSGGASQDTGLTSEVNPAAISSSRQHMDHHDASLWDY